MRMVLVPGFTQTRAAWDAVRAQLTHDVDAVALDVPSGLDFVATAHALGEAGHEAIYVGYSQGGRLCLRLALDRPDVVRGLVVVSASPGIADAGERIARGEAEERLAREAERDGVAAFIERWLAQPLFATLPHEAAGADARRAGNTVERLAHGLRALGQGVQEPLWDRLDELEPPFLAVAGTLDHTYVQLAFRMARAVRPDLHPVLIGGAGHAVHLEAPEELARVLIGFHHELAS